MTAPCQTHTYSNKVQVYKSYVEASKRQITPPSCRDLTFPLRFTHIRAVVMFSLDINNQVSSVRTNLISSYVWFWMYTRTKKGTEAFQINLFPCFRNSYTHTNIQIYDTHHTHTHSQKLKMIMLLMKSWTLMTTHNSRWLNTITENFCIVFVSL